MKKIIMTLAVCSISLGAFAWHGGCHRGLGGGYRHCYGGWHGGHYHHGYYGWGRGGCNFWPGFVGGIVGGVVGTAITTPYYRRDVVVTPAPAIVQNPVVVQNPAPVIVQQPTVIQNSTPIVVQNPTTVVTTPQVTQKVWVEGRYVDSQDSNGNVIRVWESGHWEYR